jgi:hypothetical protein
VIDKSEYHFQIQHSETDKEDIKHFKQCNHCGPVLLMMPGLGDSLSGDNI